MLLALETSAERGSVALFDADRLLGEVWLDARERHAASLLVCLDRLLTERQRRLDEVDRIALAIGPGLSRAPETAMFVRELIREAPVPSVIDADALNAFAEDAGALAERKAEAVLTPHLGELARLDARLSARPADPASASPSP